MSAGSSAFEIVVGQVPTSVEAAGWYVQGGTYRKDSVDYYAVFMSDLYVLFVTQDGKTKISVDRDTAEREYKFIQSTEMTNHFNVAAKESVTITIPEKSFSIMFDNTYPIAVSTLKKRPADEEAADDAKKARKRVRPQDLLFGYAGKKGSSWFLKSVDDGKATLEKCSQNERQRNASRWNMFCAEFNAMHKKMTTGVKGSFPPFKDINPVLARFWKSEQAKAIEQAVKSISTASDGVIEEKTIKKITQQTKSEFYPDGVITEDFYHHVMKLVTQDTPIIATQVPVAVAEASCPRHVDDAATCAVDDLPPDTDQFPPESGMGF